MWGEARERVLNESGEGLMERDAKIFLGYKTIHTRHS